MSGTGNGPGIEEAAKKPLPLGKRLLMLALGMAAFACFMLSANRLVVPGFIAVLSILEVYGLVKGIKGSKVYEALCEVEYIFVLLALLFGAHRGTLAGH